MAAPRGNLFALGHHFGRPAHFNTAEELFHKIAEYLSWEDENKGSDAKGNGKGLYTLSGCALYLGFASKSSFDDQIKRGDDFSNVISRFKLFMVHWNEQKLYWGGSFMGSKIWLMNHGGYKEEATQFQHVLTNVNPTVITSSTPLASNENDIKQ